MFHRTFIIFGSDFATKFQFPLEMLYIIFSMRNTLFTTDYTAKQMTSAKLAVSLRKCLRKQCHVENNQTSRIFLHWMITCA